MANRTYCQLGIVVAFTAIGCLTGGCARSAPEPRKSALPVAVKTVAVEARELERTTTQPATVHALHRAEIRAKASGYVVQLNADIGDYVEAGATLLVLDIPEMVKRRDVIEAQILRCEAETARAQAGLQLAQAGIASAEAKVQQARSESKQAAASLAAAEAEFRRTSDLVQRQSLEDRVLDEVRSQRDSQAAHFEATESAILAAEANVAVAQAKQASATADVLAADAETTITRRQLDELDVLIAYATIRAPFAGVVTHRSVDLGDLVHEQDREGGPLFVVSQIDKVRVQTPIPEVDAVRVNKGDVISLTFPSFPSEAISATVTRLSNDLDPSTRTMLVEVEMNNSERKLLPGMFGQAKITLGSKFAANMLPARAIRFDDADHAYVYAVSEEDTISVVEVTTGFDDGHSLEVVSGVEPGQQVVDAHLKRFVDGQKVRRLPD